jgi:hypothetical protein
MQPLNTRGKAPEHPKKSKGRLPKSHTSRQNLNTFIMEQMNFHKQKLYSLIAAGVALVALLLPWVSINFLGASQSWNGLRGWGLLSLVGIGGVVALSFIGNKSDDYTAEYKKYVMIAFGAVAAGALLFFMRKNSVAGGFDNLVKTGIGLWLCLVAGLAGVALNYGLIKIENKSETTSTNPGTTKITTTTTTPTDTTVQP